MNIILSQCHCYIWVAVLVSAAETVLQGANKETKVQRVFKVFVKEVKGGTFGLVLVLLFFWPLYRHFSWSHTLVSERFQSLVKENTFSFTGLTLFFLRSSFSVLTCQRVNMWVCTLAGCRGVKIIFPDFCLLQCGLNWRRWSVKHGAEPALR